MAIRALLYCIKEFSLDLTEIKADHFKDRMDTLAGHFLGDAKPATLQSILVDYKDVILAYIAREKDYLLDREAEFKNIIAVLTTGLTTLSQENQEFNTRMSERSVKLEKIIYLDDIRKIKEELRHEVQQMQHSVHDKQARDVQRLQDLSQEVKVLQSDVAKAQQASLTDGLTGASNRLAFDMHMNKLVEHYALAPASCVLLLLDIDNFKQINDTYGHLVGDRVIMALVQRAARYIRQDDFLARYGGEEFAVLLHGASLRQGIEKSPVPSARLSLRRALYRSSTSNVPKDIIAFTVSIGVSAFSLTTPSRAAHPARR